MFLVLSAFFSKKQEKEKEEKQTMYEWAKQKIQLFKEKVLFCGHIH